MTIHGRPTLPAAGAECVVVRIRATGLRFINGVASSYDAAFPVELTGILSQADYEQAIGRINDVLALYWPCDSCYFFGYACSLCTLGTSFLLPRLCMQHVERYALREIDDLNHSRRFREIGMKWMLRKGCLNSWIEVTCKPPASPTCIDGAV